MLVELLEVEGAVKDHAHHTGAAVFAGDLDSIYVGVNDAGEGGDSLGDLGGGDVLALPAEGVSNAVHKVKATIGVP